MKRKKEKKKKKEKQEWKRILERKGKKKRN